MQQVSEQGLVVSVRRVLKGFQRLGSGRADLRVTAYLFALRYNNWKVHFQTKDDWFAGALLTTTVPQPVNLRNDPFERHMEDPYYPIYAGEKLWTVLPAAALVEQHLATFEEFPPSQTPAEFNPQAIVNKVLAAAAERHGN